MPSVTFGDLDKLGESPKHHTPARQRRLDIEVTDPNLLPQAPAPAGTYEGRIVVAMATYAQLMLARNDLAAAMTHLAELDAEAIAAAPDDMTGIARVRHILADRQEAERQAWIRAIELANALGGVWEHLMPEERRRSGLATLIGADPEETRLLWELWTGTGPMDALAPLPEPWGIPTHLAHKVGAAPGIGSYVVDFADADELPAF